MTHPVKPPWTDTGIHTFELTGQRTGDTVSDNEIAMQTLMKDWDSYDATIYTDCGNTTMVVAASLSSSGPQVTRESTVSAVSWPANGTRLSKSKRKLCERPLNWYRRMSLNKLRTVSDSMSTLQQIQYRHQSQQDANSEENDILDALASPTDRWCHLTLPPHVSKLMNRRCRFYNNRPGLVANLVDYCTN